MAIAVSNNQTYVGPEVAQSFEVFPGIHVGDIAVSLTPVRDARGVNDLFEVREGSYKYGLKYSHYHTSHDKDDWRKATDEETAWYKSAETNRNINNMPKEEIINSYSIF